MSTIIFLNSWRHLTTYSVIFNRQIPVLYYVISQRTFFLNNHCYYKYPCYWLRAVTPWYIPVSQVMYHNHNGLYVTVLFLLPLLSIPPIYTCSESLNPWLNGKIKQGVCRWHYIPGSGLGLLLSKYQAKIWTNW